MPLLFAPIGTEVKVSRINGAAEVKQHLNEIGFNIGTTITVIQKISTGLIVKVKESRIAIDSSMAAKIMI
jgi:ferrous iron transport protein A